MLRNLRGVAVHRCTPSKSSTTLRLRRCQRPPHQLATSIFTPIHISPSSSSSSHQCTWFAHSFTTSCVARDSLPRDLPEIDIPIEIEHEHANGNKDENGRNAPELPLTTSDPSPREQAHPPRQHTHSSRPPTRTRTRTVYRSLERQDGTVPLKPREKKGPVLFPLRITKDGESAAEKKEAKIRRRRMRREHAILKSLDETAAAEQAEAAVEKDGEAEGKDEGEGEEEKHRQREEQKRAVWLELVEEAKQRRKENEAYRRLKKKAEENDAAEIDFHELVQDAMEPAIQNLDRLATLYPPATMLNDDKWTSLRSMLVDGFTIGQLEQYAKRREAEMGVSGGNEPGTWRAAMTTLLDKRSKRSKVPTEHANLRKYLQGKSGLAERILRVAWALGRENDLGRMEFKLEDLQTLVLLHDVPGRTTSPLKRIADLYDAKIEVRGAKNVIKLTGTMNACNLVHDAIHEYVDQIQQYDFSPRDLRLEKLVDRANAARIAQLEEEFFDMLEHRHSVILNTEGRGSKTVCSIISASEHDFNDASRTVELALRSQSHPFLSSTSTSPSSSAFTTFLPENESVPLARVEDLEALDWLETRGGGEFYRWVSPISKEAIPGGRSARRPPHAVYEAEDTVGETIFRNVRGKPTKKVRESGFVREVVDARVGDVVFYKMAQFQEEKEEVVKEEAEEEESEDVAKEMKAEEPEEVTPEEKLIPEETSFTFNQLMEQFEDSAKFVPGAVPADVKRKLLSIWQPISSNEYLYRVQLQPSHKNPEAPAIEVEFNVRPDTRQLTIRRANAILNPQVQHMLLPWTNNDLQFTRSFHYDLFEGEDMHAPEHEHSPTQEQEPNPVLEAATNPHSLNSVFNAFSAAFQTSSSSPVPSIPATARISLPTTLSSSIYEYILPSPTHLLSSRLHRYKYRDHELNFQAIRDGPFTPATTRSLMLTLNRYDDSPVPMVGKAVAEGAEEEGVEQEEKEEKEEKKEERTVREMFVPLYTAASRMAFEVGASVIKRGGDTGGKKMKVKRGMWSEYDPDDEF